MSSCSGCGAFDIEPDGRCSFCGVPQWTRRKALQALGVGAAVVAGASYDAVTSYGNSLVENRRRYLVREDAFDIEALQRMFDNGMNPIVVSRDVFEGYEQYLSPVVRYEDPKLAQQGYENLMFKGRPVVYNDPGRGHRSVNQPA